MDERIHEHATSSSAACPSAGPTIVFATTTHGRVAKPYSTPSYDKYPTGGTSCPPQMGQYQNPGPIYPGNPADCNILLTSEEEILLQTHGCQYNAPPESTPTTSKATPATAGQTLMIPCPNTEPPICIPHIPLRWNVNNPQAMAAHNYSLVDDLAQSPAAMYVLKVLHVGYVLYSLHVCVCGCVRYDDCVWAVFAIFSGFCYF
jgi:hypothetical protein